MDLASTVEMQPSSLFRKLLRCVPAALVSLTKNGGPMRAIHPKCDDLVGNVLRMNCTGPPMETLSDLSAADNPAAVGGRLTACKSCGSETDQFYRVTPTQKHE
jgi:hypothetical protein